MATPRSASAVPSAGRRTGCSGTRADPPLLFAGTTAGAPAPRSAPLGADGASATALQPPPHLLTTLPAPAGGRRRVCHSTWPRLLDTISTRAPWPGSGARARRRLDAWLDDRRLEDATLAAYLVELYDQGRATGERFRNRLAGGASPPGERAALGPRRLPANRRGSRSRTGAAIRGSRLWPRSLRPASSRGAESDEVVRERPPRCHDRGAPLPMAGMRRSERRAGLGPTSPTRPTTADGGSRRAAPRRRWWGCGSRRRPGV